MNLESNSLLDDTLASNGENNKVAADTHKGMEWMLSELTITGKLERKRATITICDAQYPDKTVVDGKPLYVHEQHFSNNAMNQISNVRKWLSFGNRNIASRYGIEKHNYRFNYGMTRIQSFLRGMKAVALFSLITMVPRVSALNSFDLKKTIPAIYSQLAQNAVITSFGVLCSSDGDCSPLQALANGPLSSISSAVWLWKMRKLKHEQKLYWHFTDFQVARIVVPGGPVKQLLVDSIPSIAIASASFMIYFLSFLESSEWKWALTVSASGLASEGTRLLATWLATRSVQSELSVPEDASNNDMDLNLSETAKNKTFIECQDGKIRPSRHWQQFTNTTMIAKCNLLGQAPYIWRWVNIKFAIISLLLFCVSAVFAIFSTGALVASEDGSLAGGFLSFIICYCAAGKLRDRTPADIPRPDMYYKMIAAKRLETLSNGIVETNQQIVLDAETFVFYSLMTTGGTITFKGKKYPACKPGQGGLIDMHDVYQKYARLNPIMNRIFNIVEDDTGRSILLEIADALYCRALLLVRHAHKCRHGQPGGRGQACNADTTFLLSALLLVSDHAECHEVRNILNDIKAWMNDEYLLWSIIGSNVTLEMMVLPYLRKQLESSNTLDLALRICHMAMPRNSSCC
ncbi:unnamed protein product [Umbelopsis ramanniana]